MDAVSIIVLAVVAAVFLELADWKLWAMRTKKRVDVAAEELEQHIARADQAATALEPAAAEGRDAISQLKERVK